MVSSFSLVSWLKGYNTSKDQSNYYLREESKKECRVEANTKYSRRTTGQSLKRQLM